MEIRIRSDQVPQSSKLSAVRAVMESISRKYASPATIAADTGISTRHVSYHLNAGQILGFVTAQKNGFGLTAQGRRLLDTTIGSIEEKSTYKAALFEAEFVKELLADLIEDTSATTNQIAEILTNNTPLSASTAKRRASAIVTWIKTINEPPVTPQLPV